MRLGQLVGDCAQSHHGLGDDVDLPAHGVGLRCVRIVVLAVRFRGRGGHSLAIIYHQVILIKDRQGHSTGSMSPRGGTH